MNGVSTISQIRSKYIRLRWTEVILFAVSAALISAAIAYLVGKSILVSVVGGLVAAIIVGIARSRQLELSAVDNLRMSMYLNRFYPQLKESSDILLKETNQLSTLEALQVQRIENELQSVAPGIALPHRIGQSAMAVLVAIVILIGAVLLAPALNMNAPVSSAEQSPADANDFAVTPPDPRIKQVSISIQPPAYTRLAATTSGQLSFSTVEGSRVKWTIIFHQAVSKAKLFTTVGDSVVVTKPSDKIEFSMVVGTAILYRVQWMIDGKINNSDYNRIDVKPDQVPQVAIKELPQFTRIKWGERNQINVESSIKDDYGLTAAHVIATVSKGSGESVKFREEKLPFSSPLNIGGTNVTGKLTLDFRKLGMDPGDEVYFYVEAFDNKQPAAQRNRTDTYFVALQDTTVQEVVMDDGLGVDLMPDYFRSQRQLIIDTEKLLADQKKITKQQFNSTSNELGYDQKVLRLRYGQFLGEEFETSIGESAAAEEVEDEHGEKKEEDIMSKYGHKHDTENEHNLVADKKGKEVDQHDHDEKDKDDPMAAYRHDHDSEEEATFFTQSIKAKLRAALTLMWDSELKLRLYQPKESLPYQYQILKLLKEISQDSRIYVHRMGFDPPPLKEDRRLTGVLDEVNPAKIQNNQETERKYPAIRKSLSDISDVLLSDSLVLTNQHRERLHAAGDELAAIALTTPGTYLEKLSKVKALAEGKVANNEVRSMLEEVQGAFWSVLPYEASTPTRRRTGGHQLDAKFMEEFKVKAND
jgi:hypothetical protein